MMSACHLRGVHLPVGEMYVLLCKHLFNGYKIETAQIDL